ncbi:synaptonemal complex protein 1-like [Palaemon carinicauda]|uniref:synaptonemal complex protein 1-like n=1 Tax=Palaemon carinicauda TaxID=392227 RepID=UPI0035B6520C
MKEHEKLVEALKNENEKMNKNQKEKTEQLNKLKHEVDDLKAEKEKLKADTVHDYENLEFVCKIKDLQIEQERKYVEEFKTENEKLKRAQTKKTEQLNKLKSEVDELKMEKEKLKAEKAEIHNTENKDEHERLLMAGFFAQMSNKPKEAIDIFTEALTLKTDNEEETALLHFLRAEANAATETPRNMDIVLDCSKAIEKGLEGWKTFML